VTAFSADWLALREPADVAARSPSITRAVALALSHGAAVVALDLASGTGSNLRYLAGRLPTPQRWLLVDHDPALLAQALARGCGLPGLDCEISTECRDLAALDADTIFAGRTLVTCSALLDLVSRPWLDRLASRCREHGALVLCALNYDGRIECHPPDPDDSMVSALVNRHQRTDKGFGPALGPDATGFAATSFASRG